MFGVGEKRQRARKRAATVRRRLLSVKAAGGASPRRLQEKSGKWRDAVEVQTSAPSAAEIELIQSCQA